MSTVSGTYAQSAAPAPPEITWRSWPLRDAAPWSWLVPVGLVVVGTLVGWIAGSYVWAFLATLGLAASLWRWLLPVRHELGPDGVGQQFLGRRRLTPWMAVGSYRVLNEGVLFFAVKQPAPLDALRGLYLPWGDHRDRILEILVRQLGPIDSDPEV